VLEVVAILSILFLGFLTYLVFFERGPEYSISNPLELFSDRDLLALWGSVLSVPRCSVVRPNLVQSGSGFYEHHLSLIARAIHSVHLETYLVQPGEACSAVFDALAEKARQGVEVRVILDRVGSFKVRSKHLQTLRKAGATVVFYHPLSVHTFRKLNNRTHRNLLVVDGVTAMMGGAGLADFWSENQHKNAWRDEAVIVEGSGVSHLQAVFGENWLEATGEILADSSSYPSITCPGEIPSLVVGSSPAAGGSSSARLLFQLALESARTNIDLCTPYFIPDRGIRAALIAASIRGVRVRVMTSGPYSDQGLARRAGRRRYGPLLSVGVELYEYKSHMMHLKSLVIDGRMTVLGSTNVDNRSFGLNDEVNLVVDDGPFASSALEIFERDLLDCDLITVCDWEDRSFSEKTLAYLGKGLERHD
jgi:cardiolipin synthase